MAETNNIGKRVIVVNEDLEISEVTADDGRYLTIKDVATKKLLNIPESRFTDIQYAIDCVLKR